MFFFLRKTKRKEIQLEWACGHIQSGLGGRTATTTGVEWPRGHLALPLWVATPRFSLFFFFIFNFLSF
jgi:hypothetical protein